MLMALILFLDWMSFAICKKSKYFAFYDQLESLKTCRGKVRKSRSSIFCFSCTSSCSLVERVNENMWIVAVAFLRESRKWKWFLRKINTNLTKKIMIGDIMRTRRSIAIPSACCWFAVFNSLSTVSLKTWNYAEVYFLSKLTQGVSEVLSKRFSTSQYSRRWQHSTENITIWLQTKTISNIHLESFVCVRILFLLIEHIFSGMGNYKPNLISHLPARFYQWEVGFSFYLFIVFSNLRENTCT